MGRDPLAELFALRSLEERRIVGLMSGTSADGIDVAIVALRGHGAQTELKVEHFETVPHAPTLRRRIWGLTDGNASTICELNFLIGEAFAGATLQAAQHAGIAPSELDLVGSHGQTARHQPPGQGPGCACTLQIGEGAVIAERTGLPVICDFRVADVAAGGQGAPLIPLVDYLLFRDPTETRVLLNLGGIANLTVVTAERDKVEAFDTGPANMLLDAVARSASGGHATFDRDGRLAAQGRCDQLLLAELLRLPFFGREPPKSTGRELFGRDFIYPLLDRYASRLPDLMATLVGLTVESIASAIERFVLSHHQVREVLVSGGGVHNPCVMEGLARRLEPLRVRGLDELGIDPDAKEAVGFAVLANETLFGSPGNLPRATGAGGDRVLGKIALPPVG